MQTRVHGVLLIDKCSCVAMFTMIQVLLGYFGQLHIDIVCAKLMCTALCYLALCPNRMGLDVYALCVYIV